MEFYDTGESYQWIHILVALFSTIFLHLQIVSYSMCTTAANYHRLGSTFHTMQRHLAEFLYEDGGLLLYHVLMIIVIGLDSFRSRCFLIFGIILYLFAYLISCGDMGKILQYVQDVAFLYGLLHGINMERTEFLFVRFLRILIWNAESL